eukprot:6179100-Pleurochrysis_carterae.AAC.1
MNLAILRAGTGLRVRAPGSHEAVTPQSRIHDWLKWLGIAEAGVGPTAAHKGQRRRRRVRSRREREGRSQETQMARWAKERIPRVAGTQQLKLGAKAKMISKSKRA